MNNSMKEDLLILIVVAIAVVGLYHLISMREVSSTERTLKHFAIDTKLVIKYQPSEARTAYLVHVREVAAQDVIRLRDAAKLEDLFDDAVAAEEERKSKKTRAELAKVLDKAL